MPALPVSPHSATSMPVLPWWLRVGWAVALVVVTLLHCGHAWLMRGQRRWWHVAHAGLAIAMAATYLLNRATHADLYRVGVLAFVALAVAVTAAVGLALGRRWLLKSLWLATAIDLLLMAYMLLPEQLAVLNWLGTAYLIGQALGWEFGMWPVAARADRRQLGGLVSADVRTGLIVMAGGMAFMLAAM